jgi:hypothetical protein
MADTDARGAGDSSRPRVALALGSGGARGYAHIGVIGELRDRGFQIVGIAGDNEPEPRPTAEWLNRMLGSTSALLDRPNARAVLNRFGVWDPESDVEPEPDEELDVPKLGGFEVMNRTIDIAQAARALDTLDTAPSERMD